MGVLLFNSTKTTNMKVFLVLALAICATASAQKEQIIQCREPDPVFVEPIFPAKKEQAVDLEELRAKINAINEKIEASKTEAVILDFDEIKEKYGDKLVKKLQKLKDQGKKLKLSKLKLTNSLKNEL